MDRWLEFTLDLGFDIVDGVGRFDLEGDGLTRQGLNENLHDGLVTKRQLRCEKLHEDSKLTSTNVVVLNLQQRCSMNKRSGLGETICALAYVALVAEPRAERRPQANARSALAR